MTPDPTLIIPMRPTKAALPPLKKPIEIPRTPGLLRALIADRLDRLRQVPWDSWEYIRGMQKVTELENELHALDQAAMASRAKGAA